MLASLIINASNRTNWGETDEIEYSSKSFKTKGTRGLLLILHPSHFREVQLYVAQLKALKQISLSVPFYAMVGFYSQKGSVKYTQASTKHITYWCCSLGKWARSSCNTLQDSLSRSGHRVRDDKRLTQSLTSRRTLWETSTWVIATDDTKPSIFSLGLSLPCGSGKAFFLIFAVRYSFSI